MKSGRRIAGAVLLALLLAACGKQPEQEERIRISIDQPGQQGAPAGAQPQSKAKTKAADRPAAARPAPAPAPAPQPVTTAPKPPPPAVQPARQAPPPSAPPPAPQRPPQEAPAGMDFPAVARRLTVDGSDRREVRREWERVHDKTVVWSGTVVEAEAGRRGFRVLVLAPGAGGDGRFNIILLGPGASAARSLAPGQGVRFRGVIHRAEFGTPRRGTVVTLRDVAFL